MYILFKKTSESLINIGTGTDQSITQYANLIMKHLGVKFKINYLKNKPNGSMRKVLDVSLAKIMAGNIKLLLKKDYLLLLMII